VHQVTTEKRIKERKLGDLQIHPSVNPVEATLLMEALEHIEQTPHMFDQRKVGSCFASHVVELFADPEHRQDESRSMIEKACAILKTPIYFPLFDENEAWPARFRSTHRVTTVGLRRRILQYIETGRTA
jgi:hypothetical protein